MIQRRMYSHIHSFTFTPPGDQAAAAAAPSSAGTAEYRYMVAMIGYRLERGTKTEKQQDQQPVSSYFEVYIKYEYVMI